MPGVTKAVLDVDTATEIVLLRLDRNVFHHGGLGVIRSLGRLGIPVHTMREDRLAPAALSRYARRRVSPMPASTDPDDVLDLLDRLADRLPGPAVLVTTDDAGAILLAEHDDKLRVPVPRPAGRPAAPRGRQGLARRDLPCRRGAASRHDGSSRRGRGHSLRRILRLPGHGQGEPLLGGR